MASPGAHRVRRPRGAGRALEPPEARAWGGACRPRTDPRLDAVRRKRCGVPRLRVPRIDPKAVLASPRVVVILGLAFLAFVAGSIAMRR